MTKIQFLLFVCGSTLLAQPSPDQRKQQLEYTRAHYTKYDYRIPMRDGVKLFTAVYVPKDAAQPIRSSCSARPIRWGLTASITTGRCSGPSESFTKEGFIFAYQDVRGRYLSEGTFIDVPPHKTHFGGPKDTDESTDTYDTIDWLVKNVPNNNGKRRHLGHFVSRLLCGLQPDRCASGVESGLAASPHGRRR